MSQNVACMASSAPKQFRAELEMLLCRQHVELRACLDKWFDTDEGAALDTANADDPKPKILPLHPVRGDPVLGELVELAQEAATAPAPHTLAFQLGGGPPQPSSFHTQQTPSVHLDFPCDADPTHAANVEVPKLLDPTGSQETNGSRTRPQMRKPGSQALVLTKSISENRKQRSLLHRVLKSWTYEVIMMGIVVLNAIVIGIEVQDYALLRGGEVPETFKQRQNIMEMIFLVIFIADLAFRVAVQRFEFFASDSKRWNLLDALLVMIMMLEFLARNIASLGDLLGQVPVFRVLRIFRVMRLLRIIKLLRSAKELRVMFSSIFSSVKPLCWACVILLMLLYVFGIAFTVGAVERLQETRGWDKEESQFLIHHFGSVDASVVSLFEAVTGGISWGELFDLAKDISLLHTALFMFYIIFTLLGIMNIVTGVFVETAMGYSKRDQETLIQDEIAEKRALVLKLQVLFHEIDTNKTGTVTLDELSEACKDVRMQAYLAKMGLRVDDAESLFMLLDRDQEGQVDVDEFLDGFMKLQGQASSIDVAKLELESRWILHNVKSLTQNIAKVNRSRTR